MLTVSLHTTQEETPDRDVVTVIGVCCNVPLDMRASDCVVQEKLGNFDLYPLIWNV